MDPEFRFRSLKAQEIERLLEQHYGKLERLGYQYYRLEDSRKLVFYYATGSDWYSPTVEHLHNQLGPGDLVVFAYTDEERAHLWVFAIPVEVLLERIKHVGVEPTLSGGAKYSLNLEHVNGFRLRQIDIPLADFQIASQATDLTRPLVGLGVPPVDLLAHAAPLNVEQVQRLLRWKLDGIEERGDNFDFADIRRRLNAIRPELQLLSDRPQEFTEASWKTVLDHMHSAQRPKSLILRENDIDTVRQELALFLLDDKTDLLQRFARFQESLHYVGSSIAGELISWYDPEHYPLENAADQAGLQYLGFSPGETYTAFASAFAQFREIYERIVGRLQPDIPLNLEIDQLFNQIHKSDLKAPDGPEKDVDDARSLIEAYYRITLPDQGTQATVWPICLQHGIAAIGFREREEDYTQVHRFAQIRSGDWIVAFLRNKRIGAIGQVTAPYDPDLVHDFPPEQDYWDGDLRRRIEVTWYPREISVEQLSPETRNRFWQKTVVTLSPAEFSEVREFYRDLLPDDEEQTKPPIIVPYTVQDFVQRTFQADERWYSEVTDLLREKGQIILYGPPGTGKTFIARELAKTITGLTAPGPERYRLVQFHPSYSYEEFIEGIRLESRTVDGRHVVEYPVRAGAFKRFCQDAAQQDGFCVFSIDEINRGNIASVFGELMYALEYRDQAAPAVLPYSGESFVIPENVLIIGTMNTADRSISLMDFALRRRFHFVRCEANPRVLQLWSESRNIRVPYLLPLYELLLEEIKERDYQIGMSYFMDEALTEERLRRIWKHSIEPYLETYFIDDPDRVEPLRWEGTRVRELRQLRDGKQGV